MREKVINFIKEHRKRLGMTQEDLAKRAGVSRQSIISIEQGRYIPSLPLALKLGKLFQRSTDELFELKEGS
ncbi:MAG: helix-turn-helix transcriptional regulator [Candidatus Aminicenantales bacterium]